MLTCHKGVDDLRFATFRPFGFVSLGLIRLIRVSLCLILLMFLCIVSRSRTARVSHLCCITELMSYANYCQSCAYAVYRQNARSL